ncbi:hypothetical protein SAMN05660209_04139 [Geodermatophilus africanus]|uniref:DUF4878 domain-containing protein n=1 Tax=Geodermatophilus africanus TaxID=1137993 RepID=A0A1H3NZ67_9ACTN|nr:hypothetical protein [Geodermatophilus africanus]SDY94098.1 hypothetical protein SAMN05660209_04139 [Geodermatophilus africanus]
MSTGPYLYDDDPAPLHTGTPRSARALILAVIGGTVAVAVGMAVGLPLVKGSPEEQAREVSGVFLSALAQDDVETAYGLLCAEERARVSPGAVSTEYAAGGTGRIAGTIADELDGEPVQRVEVAWSDGSTSVLTVVSEQGARVCGTASA